MIKIYNSTIDYLDDNEKFAEKYSMISEYRKRKIDAIKGEEERKRSLAAECLLMEAFWENDILYDGQIEVGPHGKPMLANNPSIFYNLSHSGNQVLCVISDSEVGCDVERIERVSDKIVERFFTEEEKKKIEAIANEEMKIIARARLWCLKESYGKMTGEGLGAVIDKIQFNVQRKDRSGNLEGAKYHYWEMDGYCYAYCVRTTNT